MIKTISLIGLLLVLICAANVFAGSRKHELPAAFSGRDVTVKSFLVPGFYYTDTVREGDTTFAYVCYDQRDSVIDADTVQDFAHVYFLSLFKSYIDHLHTYRDNDGSKKPLPVSIIIERYDRLGPNRWNHISYPDNHYEELREYRNEILRTDTIKQADEAAHTLIKKVYQYYKITSEN